MIRKTTLAIAALAAAGFLAARPAPAAAQTRNFFCESRDHDRTYCAADTSQEVRFIRRLSDAECVRGRSWDYDRRGVWVSRGCRAEFAVGRFNTRREDDDRYPRDRDRDWDDRDRDRDRDWDDRDRGRWDDNRGNRSERYQAEQVCRRATRDRVRSARNGVDVRFSGRDRLGNRIVRWNTSRASGTCRVDRYDRLAGFQIY